LNTPSNPIQSLARREGWVYGWGLTEELELVTKLSDVEKIVLAHIYLLDTLSFKAFSFTKL
jgi:hypothetical protein